MGRKGKGRDEKFAKLLNRLLEEADMSGSKLAAKLGVDRGTVARWRNGYNLPESPESVLGIAKSLNALDLLPELMESAGFHYEVSQAQPGALQERESSNIPSQPAPLVGRDAEIDKLTDLLREGRLITIWGPGGIGKTSLAIEVSARMRNEFDETWIVTFLEKSGDWSFQQLVQSIADTLKVKFDEGSSSLEQLVAFLQSKKILLVLDSFEEVLDEKLALAELLEKTLYLKILVTSQIGLDLEKEQKYELRELALPPEGCSTDAFIRYPAIALFVKKIQQDEPDFELDDNSAVHVRRIAQLVDGFPLGLRLAAGMCRGRSFESVADELSRNLERLNAEYQDMDERHRNFFAVFESAWRRLDEQGRELVPQLAIFKGGFTEDAARQICGAFMDGRAGPAGEEQLFTSILSSLREYSFVQYDRVNNRYVMYEPLRKFAEQKLDSSDRDYLRQNHAQYFMRRLEAQRQFVLSGDIKSFEKLALEFHDISEGLSWLLDDRESYDETRPYLDLFWEVLDSQNRHQDIIALSERVMLLDLLSDQPRECKRFQAEWLLRKGVSHYKSGQLEQGKHSLIAALGELNENVSFLSGGRQANMFELARELLTQLQYRLSISFTASQDDNQSEFEMRARAYDTLSQIYFFDGNVGLTEYVVLRGANLAEKAASSEELIARFYANLCIGLVLEPWSRPFARHYAGLALKLAAKLKRSEKIKDRSTAAYVYTVLSMYEIGLCNLEEGRRLARLALEISERLHKSRQYIEAAAMQINVLEFQGYYKDAQRVWGEVWVAASRYGDKQAIRWARAGIAEEYLNLGVDSVETDSDFQGIFSGRTSLVEIVKGLIQESVEENDKSILVNLRSLLATIYLRNDMLADATKILQEDFEVIQDDKAQEDRANAKTAQILKLTDFSGYSGTAEVSLRLQERVLRDKEGLDREEIDRIASWTFSRLAYFASVYPVATCRHLTLKGLREWNAGRYQEAKRSWRQSIARAQEQKMKFDEALALYELGRHESADRSVRQQCLKDAFGIFREIDSRYMMMTANSELEQPSL